MKGATLILDIALFIALFFVVGSLYDDLSTIKKDVKALRDGQKFCLDSVVEVDRKAREHRLDTRLDLYKTRSLVYRHIGEFVQ